MRGGAGGLAEECGYQVDVNLMQADHLFRVLFAGNEGGEGCGEDGDVDVLNARACKYSTGAWSGDTQNWGGR